MITKSQSDRLLLAVRGVYSLMILTEVQDTKEVEAVHTILEMINRQIWDLYEEFQEERKGSGDFDGLRLVKANPADESESDDQEGETCND
ncbi:MAG TPA: hypothetical protein VGK99_03920 [Acidobacteriota bacterium]|jgi:hypothetical protein